MTMTKSVVVVGSVALDTVETAYGKHSGALGGAAVYFSLAGRFFASPMMIGVVGGDFPHAHVSMLRRNGVDTQGLQRVSGKSFRWAGRYSSDGNVAHTLDTQLGVFAEFQPEVPERYKSSSVLFLANIDPELQYRVLGQMNGALAGGDTMNFWINGKRPQLLKVLKRLHLLFVNDQEARLLTGEHSLLKASRALLKLGPSVAVVKKGEHGSTIVTKNFIHVCPPYPIIDVCDPTGAGDSFAGAFMSVLATAGRRANRLDRAILSKAAAYGSVVSSFTVQSFGVKGLLSLRRAAFQRRLRELKQMAAMSC